MQTLSVKESSIRNIVLAIIGLIISSKITLPLYPVPITMQMFAVYYIGLMMTPRESFTTILGWISLGAMGFPVFASSIGGISGPSAGYIIGMILGCPAVSLFKKKPITACIVCYVIVHIFGCVWLSTYINWNDVFVYGVIPFLIPELLKITSIVAIYNKSK